MKRFFVCFLIVISLVPLSAAISVPLDTPVYVTPHGEKYHREGCSYVSTARELTISAAILQGYEPCSRCDPDTFTSAYIPPADESNHSGASSEESPPERPPSVPSAPRRPPVISSHSSGLDFFTVLEFAIIVFAIAGTIFFYFGIPFLQHRKARRQYEQARARYALLYGSRTRSDIALLLGMPVGTAIGPDDLPFEPGKEHWGETYTFFVAPHGRLYHAHPGCHPAATTPAHCLAVSSRRPCPKCQPQMPDLSWRQSYLRTMSDLRYYGVEIKPGSYVELCGTMLLRAKQAQRKLPEHSTDS